MEKEEQEKKRKNKNKKSEKGKGCMPQSLMESNEVCQHAREITKCDGEAKALKQPSTLTDIN